MVRDIPVRLAAFVLLGLAAAPGRALGCQEESARSADAERDVHRVLGLLDYLASDYPGAVQAGRVVDAAEFEEQNSLAAELVSLCQTLPAAPRRDEIAAAVKVLREGIAGTAFEGDVQASARRARKLVLETYDVKLSPAEKPDLTRGAAVYRANCALCHGELGDAATERAKQLTPPPLSFLGDKARASLSPYQTFNVSTFGVAGTSMASFDLVPARERWDAAFYVAALRHPQPPAAAPAGLPAIALHELAVLTDAELDARLAVLGRSETQRPVDLAWLRAHPPGPIADLTAAGDGGRLVRARAELERTCSLYREGKSDEAVRVSLDSYLRDIEPVEVSLRAGDRALAGRIEAGYVALRGEMRAGVPPAAIARAAEAIDRDLTYADVKLTGGRSAAVSALASLFIILREGVEAVLLVAAMLGLVRKLGRPDAAKSIHAAWLAALAAGGLTWAAARWLVSVSAAQRELVEGVVGLLAAGILAYTSYWILSRADAKHWLDFLRTQLSGALERRGRAAMFGVAFLAVYREAFETVLFYEALLTETDGGGTAPVVLGFAAGVLLLTVVAFGILRLSKKLPIRAFFTVSGALLYALAFVFAGAGIHALVEGGYLDPRPIRFPTIEWLGIYPDLLGLGLQAAFVAAVALGLMFELRSRRRAVAAT